MRVTNIINQIQAQGVADSIPEEIFRERQRGTMSLAESNTNYAVWVSDNTHKYIPKFYPEVSPTVLAYADARAKDMRGRDAELSLKMGRWIHLIHFNLSQNEADHSLLGWCFGLLETVKLEDNIEKIKSAIKRFEENKVPHDAVTLCLRVQVLDSNDKVRGART